MGVFFRTEWRAENNEPLEARKLRAALLLAASHLKTIAGEHWYEQGISEQDALLRPLNVLDPSVPKPWEEVRLSGDKSLHRLSLWNGADDERGVELSICLRVPPCGVPDTFVVSLTRPRLLITTGIAWEAMLALGRTLANAFGGLTILSAGDLVAIAEERKHPNPDAAVYAAFWGTECAENDGAHAPSRGQGLTPAYELVVARSWNEVFNPDPERFYSAIKLLARTS